jgi:hypothetical protein
MTAIYSGTGLSRAVNIQDKDAGRGTGSLMFLSPSAGDSRGNGVILCEVRVREETGAPTGSSLLTNVFRPYLLESYCAKCWEYKGKQDKQDSNHRKSIDSLKRNIVTEE